MTWYRARLEGRNYQMDVDGRRQRMGLRAVRFVEADDAGGAELEAINMLRFEPRLQKGIRNDDADPPVLVVTALEEISAEAVPGVTPGLLFYPDK